MHDSTNHSVHHGMQAGAWAMVTGNAVMVYMFLHDRCRGIGYQSVYWSATADTVGLFMLSRGNENVCTLPECVLNVYICMLGLK